MSFEYIYLGFFLGFFAATMLLTWLFIWPLARSADYWKEEAEKK